jgi:hypothetical protein
MDKYRLLAQREEIASMAKKAPVMEMGQIWQTLPSKREVYVIKSMEVLKEAMIFQTTLPFDFDDQFPIYIKINFKNLIFKLSPGEFRIFNNQLSCTYPKEAKAIESRTFERTSLPKKSNIHLTLRTLSSSTALDIKVNLENVSETGLGIKASSLNLEYFNRNSIFLVIKVSEYNWMEEATLTVKHISKKDNKSFISIGLKASMPFSDRFFEILRSQIKKERSLGN